MTAVFRTPGVAHRARLLLWLAAVLLLACHFALCLQQNGKTFLDAQAYSHYQEKRPYQYRALMAPVMGGLMHVFSAPAPQRLLAKLPVYVSTPTSAAYVFINTVGFAASCLLMFAIARRSLRTDAGVRLAVAVYIGMAYLFFCLNPNVAFILPYDVASLALTQACLLCILSRRWIWLYPLFALATINRESSFLVILFLGVKTAVDAVHMASTRQSLRPLLGHVVALCALWLAIKLGLYWMFSALPSDEGLRLVYNLRSLAKPWQWPALGPLLASFGVSLWSLRFKPAQPEWAITGTLGFALVFVVGQLTETRAFADLMVFFSVAIAQWLERPKDEPLAVRSPAWPRSPNH